MSSCFISIAYSMRLSLSLAFWTKLTVAKMNSTKYTHIQRPLTWCDSSNRSSRAVAATDQHRILKKKWQHYVMWFLWQHFIHILNQNQHNLLNLYFLFTFHYAYAPYSWLSVWWLLFFFPPFFFLVLSHIFIVCTSEWRKKKLSDSIEMQFGFKYLKKNTTWP